MNKQKEMNIVKILKYLRVPLYLLCSTYGYSCIRKNKYKFYIRRNSVTPTGGPNKYNSSTTYGYSSIGKISISPVVPKGTLVSVI